MIHTRGKELLCGLFVEVWQVSLINICNHSASQCYCCCFYFVLSHSEVAGLIFSIDSIVNTHVVSSDIHLPYSQYFHELIAICACLLHIGSIYIRIYSVSFPQGWTHNVPNFFVIPIHCWVAILCIFYFCIFLSRKKK